MPNSNTVARSMHDVGLAAWFGGSLMGAIGLNAASGEVGEPKERARVANAGWARWTGPNAVAIGAHLMGATILLKANSKRVVAQQGAPKAALVKVALTGVALGATAYARIEGQKLIAAGDPPVSDATTPSADTPPEIAAAQRRLRLLQWTIPAATGALLVLAAAQSEQQRPAQVAAGVIKRFLPDAVAALPAVAGELTLDVRERAQDAAERAQKRARKANRRARKQARKLAGRAQDITSRAQGRMEAGTALAHGAVTRAQSATSTLAERLPAPLGERLAG